MKKTTRLLTLFLTPLILSGCFGGGSEVEQAGLIQQSFQNFTVSVPSDWRKIFSDAFANTLPEETVSLFLKKVDGDDFIQNTNVVKESINTDATSLEYAKANVLLGSKALVDYRSITTEEVQLGEVQTVVHVFRARNATTEPLRHYTQGYFSRDRLGFTITCVAKDDDQIQQQNCDVIVKSFRFK
jgi:hypothetical protein